MTKEKLPIISYLDAMQLVKASFLDGSEKGLISNYISDHFDQKPLSIFDVGIGDGQYVWKLMSRLERSGIQSKITGIDPMKDSEDLISRLYPNFNFIRDRFENYRTEGKEAYDIVTSVHSLYYLDDMEKNLEKMVNITKKGGLTIIVLWAEQCALSKLYRPCKGCAGFFDYKFTTAEDVHKHAQTIPEVTNTELIYFPGRINLSSWKSMPGTLSSACMIFSRKKRLEHPLFNEHVGHLRTLLDHFSGVEQRINGIVVIKK